MKTHDNIIEKQDDNKQTLTKTQNFEFVGGEIFG